jgi:hypothetical protein
MQAPRADARSQLLLRKKLLPIAAFMHHFFLLCAARVPPRSGPISVSIH